MWAGHLQHEPGQSNLNCAHHKGEPGTSSATAAVQGGTTFLTAQCFARDCSVHLKAIAPPPCHGKWLLLTCKWCGQEVPNVGVKIAGRKGNDPALLVPVGLADDGDARLVQVHDLQQ